MTAIPLTTLRLQNQLLLDTKLPGAQQVVQHLGAMQAQDFHGAKWAVGQRMAQATDKDIERAFNAGEILRTHILRPTWHFVAPLDIRWILQFTAPRIHRLNAYMYRQTELDEAVFTKANVVLSSALQDRQFKTRKQLADVLVTNGIEASGLRLGYIMMHAELEGLVCSGPLQGKQHTYALIEEWVPSAPSVDPGEALCHLILRFMRSHGPATANDFSRWASIPVTEVQRGLEAVASDLERLIIDGKTYYWSGTPDTHPAMDSPVAHLLPNYDEYFLQDGSTTAASGQMSEILAAGRMDGHHIVIDGALRGGWRRQLSAKHARLTIDRFDAFRSDEEGALEASIRQYGDFLGTEIVVS